MCFATNASWNGILFLSNVVNAIWIRQFFTKLLVIVMKTLSKLSKCIIDLYFIKAYGQSNLHIKLNEFISTSKSTPLYKFTSLIVLIHKANVYNCDAILANKIFLSAILDEE